MKKKKIAISAKMPFAADVWYMLRRNKGAMFGLIFICIIVLLALFADVIADYSLVTETNPLNVCKRPAWSIFSALTPPDVTCFSESCMVPDTAWLSALCAPSFPF